MMKVATSTALLLLTTFGSSSASSAFVVPSPPPGRQSRSFSSSTTRLRIVVEDNEYILDKIKRIVSEAENPPLNPRFDAMIQDRFPGAIDNGTFEKSVIGILANQGFNSRNTLLATSLCCDELARQLEYDFVEVFGKNFNMGGLAGFPFGGRTAFGAMAGHVPDDGYCFFVYGPHVGVTEDGTVGKVERDGIRLVDGCCGSALAALKYLKGVTAGGVDVDLNVQSFTDFQQFGVKQLILPHANRLMNANNVMTALPYSLYESQEQMVNKIVQEGCDGLKVGIAVLGGIQINTGPRSPDYFHPLRFDLINKQGQVVADLLPMLYRDTNRGGLSMMADPSSPRNYF